jgi:hypothetical protein
VQEPGRKRAHVNCALNSAALAALSSMVVRDGSLAGGILAPAQLWYLWERKPISFYMTAGGREERARRRRKGQKRGEAWKDERAYGGRERRQGGRKTRTSARLTRRAYTSFLKISMYDMLSAA